MRRESRDQWTLGCLFFTLLLVIVVFIAINNGLTTSFFKTIIYLILGFAGLFALIDIIRAIKDK
jgi:uncharacterized membrane protein YuzA (DUF378 family)